MALSQTARLKIYQPYCTSLAVLPSKLRLASHLPKSKLHLHRHNFAHPAALHTISRPVILSNNSRIATPLSHSRSISSSVPRFMPQDRRNSAPNTPEKNMEHFVQDAAAGADMAANKMVAPYAEQNPQEIAKLLRDLEVGVKDKKHAGFSARKTKFSVAQSRDHLTVESWKMGEYDYKKPNLPTYARGLFTTKTRNNNPEIAIRGYDKFFNTGETSATRWEDIEKHTKGPYELTLKENGCIIFLGGMEDGTLLVCSKHSTGDRSDVQLSHAAAGEQHIERQLQALGKTKAELARELRARNATAVCELCDDGFEEHILAYGPEKAGLYLHGININVPTFMTYSTPMVHHFADGWGFKKVGLITMNTVGEVRSFLDQCAESGAHDGRDVEGFVVRCKRTDGPKAAPHDWFFKYKFEEPYLLYRQWRECTKAIIAGKAPKVKKHQAITQEYLQFAKKRLAADPNLGKLYNQNHGIIALRNDFLAFKNIAGSDAAKFEEMYGTGGQTDVTGNVILVPIATIGCGKTTIAVALSKLFNYGHVQNDNITGSKRPPRFTKAVLDQLAEHKVVTADRNNAQKHERKQLITDVRMQNGDARLVALHFVHDDMRKVRQIAQERVLARGDNHQTIQAAKDPDGVKQIMEGFLHRFEPIDMSRDPDEGFDACITLDPTAGSRQNLEIVVKELKSLYPSLLETDPTPEELDAAIQEATGYRPDLRHTVGGRNSGKGKENNNKGKEHNSNNQQQKTQKKKLEYMSVDVPAVTVRTLLNKTFAALPAEQARLYKQLQDSRRVQPKFHVTLMHRAAAKEQPELWERYTKLHAEATAAAQQPEADVQLGECEVVLERVVCDDRLMAIVVRLNDASPENRWQCANNVAHITVGTRDESVKPKESNELLARWLLEGPTAENRIVDVGLEGRPVVKGTVRPVLSR